MLPTELRFISVIPAAARRGRNKVKFALLTNVLNVYSVVVVVVIDLQYEAQHERTGGQWRGEHVSGKHEVNHAKPCCHIWPVCTADPTPLPLHDHVLCTPSLRSPIF